MNIQKRKMIMPTAGQQLYECYQQSLSSVLNSSTDDWEALPEDEREVWEATVKKFWGPNA
jgi:hypothetical protein